LKKGRGKKQIFQGRYTTRWGHTSTNKLGYAMEINEAAPNNYPKMSPLEFLQWERQQEFKHEYFDGEIFATAGHR